MPNSSLHSLLVYGLASWVLLSGVFYLGWMLWANACWKRKRRSQPSMRARRAEVIEFMTRDQQSRQHSQQ